MKDLNGRRLNKKSLSYYYLKVELEFENKKKKTDALLYKKSITMAMKELFGEVGACVNVDVLKFNENDLTSILRVDSENYVKLRSALTLYGSFLENKDSCAFHVVQSSQHLISLSVGRQQNYVKLFR